jgi:hypothetical protein
MLAPAAIPVPAGELLARAIDARGGPIGRLERDSEAVVHVGIPGSWEWRLELAPPARMHFALRTAGEDQHWVSDGENASVILGNTVVSQGPLASSEALSIVRFLAVIQLDALLDPAWFVTREVGAEGAGGDDRRVLAVRGVQEPVAHYRLHFDDRLRLVLAEGPLAIPAIGSGSVRIHFSDFRRVEGYLLSFAARYEQEGALLLEESVVRQRAFAEPPATEP